MPPVLTRVRPARVPSLPLLRIITGAFAGFLFLAWLFPALENHPVAERLTVENPTAFDVDVTVLTVEGRTGKPGGLRLALGSVPARGTAEFTDVLDQGWAWVFRFSGAGAFGGEYAAGEDDLRRRNWSVDIPADVAERLGEAGLAPTAP